MYSTLDTGIFTAKTGRKGNGRESDFSHWMTCNLPGRMIVWLLIMIG